MDCRLNNDAASFQKAADNLRRTAQLAMNAEQLRLMVEEEDRRVIAAQQAGAISTDFMAHDCQVPDQPHQMRISAGVDGVMVPLVTEAEQKKRRKKSVKKRRGWTTKGRELKPLPTHRPGLDLPYKEFKMVTFCNQP